MCANKNYFRLSTPFLEFLPQETSFFKELKFNALLKIFQPDYGLGRFAFILSLDAFFCAGLLGYVILGHFYTRKDFLMLIRIYFLVIQKNNSWLKTFVFLLVSRIYFLITPFVFLITFFCGNSIFLLLYSRGTNL